MEDDLTLLRSFVEHRDQRNFARLVERHLGLVFGTAVRRLAGDTHLAEEVAQSVFVDLARKAPALLHLRVLAGWLYTSTVFAAGKAVRAEQRRRHRETQAHAMQELDQSSAPDVPWEQLHPVLDDALRTLSARDREAILLRYFGAQGFSAIGAALQLSENGARMRVDRALGKLRGQLARRGIASTVAALGATLSAHAVTAAPVALATTVTNAALAGASSGGLVALWLNFFAMTKVQIGVTAALVTIGAVAVTREVHTQSALRAEIARDAAHSATLSPDQLRTDMVNLAQAAADFRALQARHAALAEIRREMQALQERQARLTPRPDLRAGANAGRGDAASAASGGRDPSARVLDFMPRPIARVAPVYPSGMRQAGIPGEVTVSLIVDAEGHAQDIKVVETTHPDFVAPALQAVEHWQFAPGQKGGRVVNARIQIPIHFAVENPNWF